jgi:hypothetical protein
MDTKKMMEMLKQKKAALKTKDKTIKPQPGTNRYILLAGWRPEEQHVWYHDFGQHFIKNAADEIQAVYPCNEAIFGKPCPVCEGLQRAQHAASDDETVELLKKAKSSRRHLVNVLALDSEDPNTPQILELTTTAFGQLLEAVEEWAETIFDPSEAQIFTITREGKGLNTKYSVQVSPKRQAVPKAALAKLPNLDEYVVQESDEQKRKALSAISAVAGIGYASDKPATTLAIGSGGRTVAAEVEDADVAVATKPSKAALEDDLDSLLGDLDA